MKKRDVNGLGGTPGVHSTGVSAQHLHTSDLCIPSSQHTAAQPLLQTTGNLLEKEKSGRSTVALNVCVCFCEFKGMFTCLSQTTWGKKEGRAKGAKLGLLLTLCVTLPLSPFTDCHQEYRKHSQGFPAIQNKKQDPPFPLSLPPSAC